LMGLRWFVRAPATTRPRTLRRSRRQTLQSSDTWVESLLRGAASLCPAGGFKRRSGLPDSFENPSPTIVVASSSRAEDRSRPSQVWRACIPALLDRLHGARDRGRGSTARGE